jgi:hypothetical protein
MSRPYLSVPEFKQSMSGELLSAFDDNALAELLEECSAWADEQTFQKLEATLDTETLQLPCRRAVWRPDGTIHVTTEFSPIIAVTALSMSFDGSNFSPLNYTVRVKTRQSFIAFPAGTTVFSASPYGSPTVWLQFSYLDGYPNAFLTENESAGETDIDVDDPTGIQPLATLHVYDAGAGPAAQEDVTVAANYVAGAATIPLANGLKFAHGVGTRVSAMPSAIKNAVNINASEHIDVPGRRQLQVDSSGQMHAVQSAPSQLPEARKNLMRYARAI